MSRETARNLSREPFCPLPLDEKFLAGLCNGLIEAVFVVELPSSLVVYCNAGAEALFGYPAAEIVDQPTARLFVEQTAFDRLYQTALPEINTNGFWRGEWEYRRSDGSRFTAKATATLLRTDIGSYMTLVVRETTRRKEEMEETIQLREKEHLAAIGTAAAMLAHEIKNPLNGISTTVQLLERSLGKAQPTKETMMATVLDLENEIGRLQKLLGDFQTISRPQRVNFEPLDLAEIVREIATLVDEECRKSKIEIRVEPAADLPLVDADPDKIKQALQNLIKNSCEAMPDGGRLTIKVYVCGNEVCLDVMDTGEGIPEGLQIFDLFTSTKPGGTGLGLVIVQQIILAHGGSVTFSSRPGQGTAFRLRLRAPKKSAV